MENYRGVIIEESLADKSALAGMEILSTKVEPVTEKHQTPWLSQWTLHTVEVPADKAQDVAEKLSKSLDTEHPGSWYADFKSDTRHYIIFPERVFSIDRKSAEEYEAARQYGISLGIPEHQVPFSKHIVR